MVRRSCCSKQAPNTRRVQTEQTLQTCTNRLMHASYEVAGCWTEPPNQATTWPAGFVVYQRGAQADGMFIVVRGRIVLRSRVKAGRAFVPALAREGETFGWEGLGANARYATDARADEKSKKLHPSSSRFREFVREQPQH